MMILKFKILIIGGFLFFILKFYYVGFIKIFSINFMYCMGCMYMKVLYECLECLICYLEVYILYL